jgi:hypothetical protein
MPLDNEITHPNEIAKRLANVTAELKDLEQVRGRLVLDCDRGIPKAIEQLAALLARIETAGALADNLRSALGVAQQDERYAAAARRHAARVEQYDQFKALMAVRSNAANELAEGIAKACAAWRALLKVNTDIANAVPTECNLPFGAIGELSRVRGAVASELYRLSADDHIGGEAVAFPGAAADAHHARNTAAITPLTEQVEIAAQHILASVAAQIASLENPTPPAAGRPDPTTLGSAGLIT